MNVVIVVVGLATLVMLAVLVGLLDRTQDDAWRGIAAQRRANWERRRRLEEIADTLLRDAGVCSCRGCRTVRRLLGRRGES